MLPTRNSEEPDYFTTKDTKSSKEDKAFDLLDAFQLDDELIFYQQVHAIAAVQVHSFVLHRFWMLQLESNAILRVLRALRGEFSLPSVPCEPESEVGAVREPPLQAKRQGTFL